MKRKIKEDAVGLMPGELETKWAEKSASSRKGNGNRLKVESTKSEAKSYIEKSCKEKQRKPAEVVIYTSGRAEFRRKGEVEKTYNAIMENIGKTLKAAGMHISRIEHYDPVFTEDQVKELEKEGVICHSSKVTNTEMQEMENNPHHLFLDFAHIFMSYITDPMFHCGKYSAKIREVTKEFGVIRLALVTYEHDEGDWRKLSAVYDRAMEHAKLQKDGRMQVVVKKIEELRKLIAQDSDCRFQLNAIYTGYGVPIPEGDLIKVSSEKITIIQEHKYRFKASGSWRLDVCPSQNNDYMALFGSKSLSALDKYR